MSNIALIPARGGSKGISRKNIKLFNSKPLIYWSIKTALESKYIDRVIVSTEDEEIAQISRSFSAEVPFMRPESLANDDSPTINTVLHALRNLSDVENVLLMQPTSPLRRTVDIEGIFTMRSEFNSDSAVSLTEADKHPDLFFNLDSRKRIKSLNNNIQFLPRQAYPKNFMFNGALYLSTSKSILDNNSFVSSNTIGYIMPKEYSIDIDTQLDWEIAEFLMTKLL